MDERLTLREKGRLLWGVVRYDTPLAGALLALSLVAAVLEGVGMGFILPIIEVASGGAAGATGDRLLATFVAVYDVVGVPFTLGNIVVGVSLVMAVRFGVQFVVSWLKAVLVANYARDLRTRLFERTLEARIERLDELGSDDLLNAIITQVGYQSRVVTQSVDIVQKTLVGVVYLGLAFYITPQLAVLAIAALGGVTLLIQWVIRPAYATGDALADANERIQETAQTGIQGARDVRLFTMRERVRDQFVEAVDTRTGMYVRLLRTTALLSNLYMFASAVTVFALIYVALEVYALSIGSFAVFLFAMFRLAPTVSSLNSMLYGIDSQLPHLVRTERVIDDLTAGSEPVGRGAPAPERVDTVDFDGVSYTYPDGTPAIRDVSFSTRRGETVAFVGQSGAGKSTVVSLLTRFYDATDGCIEVNGRDVTSFDVDSWRSKVAVVRQDPFLFNDTLRYNVTVGRPDVSRERLDRVCEVARISEFLPDLPDGLETMVGDDGVRLSGGQRQRVALARALLLDADVLVLDEATSHLDPSLERDVHEALSALDRDQITVVIAHRLSTIADADRIYTIDDGRVVEVGTHEELLTREGAYATLYADHERVTA